MFYLSKKTILYTHITLSFIRLTVFSRRFLIPKEYHRYWTCFTEQSPNSQRDQAIKMARISADFKTELCEMHVLFRNYKHLWNWKEEIFTICFVIVINKSFVWHFISIKDEFNVNNTKYTIDAFFNKKKNKIKKHK